jgi:hypothetical protein
VNADESDFGCPCGGAWVPRADGKTGRICGGCGDTPAELEIAVRLNGQWVAVPISFLLRELREAHR